MAKNINQKRITLQDYLEAEEMAVMGMAKYMHDVNCMAEDEETMGMMLGLIVQVTTKMQAILFGEPEEGFDKVFNVTSENLSNFEREDETLIEVVEDDIDDEGRE